MTNVTFKPTMTVDGEQVTISALYQDTEIAEIDKRPDGGWYVAYEVLVEDDEEEYPDNRVTMLATVDRAKDWVISNADALLAREEI